MKGFFVTVACASAGLLVCWFLSELVGPKGWTELIFFGGGGLSAVLSLDIAERLGISW